MELPRYDKMNDIPIDCRSLDLSFERLKMLENIFISFLFVVQFNCLVDAQDVHSREKRFLIVPPYVVIRILHFLDTNLS